MVGTWIAPQVAAAPPSYLYYSLSPTQKWHLCFHIAHHQTYDKFLDGKFKYSSSQFERTFLLPPTQNSTQVFPYPSHQVFNWKIMIFIPLNLTKAE